MKRLACTALLIAAALLLPASAGAQSLDSLNFLATDLLTGAVDIASNDSLLIAIYPTGYAIFGNRDTDTPDSLYQGGFRGQGHAVSITGRYAHLAIGTGGLLTLDLANPAEPVPVDTIAPDSSFQRMALWSGRLFVIDQGVALLSFDMRNPQRPDLVHLEPIFDGMLDVAVGDSTAWVSTERSGIRSFDATNFRLQALGSIDVDAPGRLDVAEDQLVVALGPDGARLYDATNPAAPFPVGTYSGELVEDVAFLDTFVVASRSEDRRLLLLEPNRMNAGPIFELGVDDGVQSLHTVASKLYVGTIDGGIRIVDIVLPQSTALLGFLEAGDFRFQSAKLRADTAYVSMLGNGVAIVDLTDPGASNLVRTVQTTNNAFLARPYGDRLIVSELGSGIGIYDFAGNETSRIFFSNGVVTETEIDGTTLYIAAGAAGLVSVDITDPDAPVHLDTVPAFPTGAGASSVSVQGNRLVFGEGASVRLVDATDPSNLVLLDDYTTNESVFDVAIQGDAVFGLKQLEGLLVLDAADSANLDSTTVIAMDRPDDQIFWKMEQEGDLLFIVRRATFLDTPGALNILQIGNPLEPILLQSIATRGKGGVFDVDGGLIALGEETQGLEVFASLEQHALGVSGFAATRTRVSAVHVSDNRILVGDFAGNLYAYGLFAGDSLARQSSFFVGDRIFDIVSVGNLAYVNLGRDRIIEFEIDTDNSLRPFRAIVDIVEPRGLAFDGEILYVAARDEGLYVYDVTSDPLRLERIGTYTTNQTSEGDLADAEADVLYLDDENDVLYVMARRRQATAHLFAIAVNNPFNPQFVSSFSTSETITGGRYFDCVVADGYAYLAKQAAGMDVVDLTNPLQPELHRELNVRNATSVEYAGGFLFVARGLDGYQVLDVRNVEQIQTLFVQPPAGDIQSVSLLGSFLFLNNGTGISLFGQKIANVDEIPPFLTIGVLPSPWITAYVDIVVVASEQLTEKPRVTFQMGEVDSSLFVLTQDLANSVYHTTLRLDQVGLGNILASGEDLAGNKSESNKGFAVRKARGARGGTIPTDSGSVQIRIPPGRAAPESFVYLMSIDETDKRAPALPADGRALAAPMQQLWLGPLEREVEVEAWDLLPADDDRRVPVAHYWTGDSWRAVPTEWDRNTGRATAGLPGSGVFAVVWKDEGPEVPPARVVFHGNRPNPFNPTTRLLFTLPDRTPVSLAVHDIAGRRVRTLVDRTLPAGDHAVDWDGTDASGRPVASGVYFARFEAGSTRHSSRMVLVR